MLRRPKIAENVIVQDVRDEMCLLHLDTGDVLVLNQTAADIWLLASDGMGGSAVAAALSSAYATPVEDLADEVTSTLDAFEQRGFLVDDDVDGP